MISKESKTILAVKKVLNIYNDAPSPQRETMLEMRKRILAIIPNAEEVVSYGMPAFKVNGTVIAGLLAHKNHVGFYPFSGSVLGNFKSDPRNFKYTKSALHIPIDKPLPKSLLKKLLNARISQCPVQRGEVDLKKYEKLDGIWRDLGLAAPARRALVNAKLLKLNDLKKISESELKKLHGMGPTAIKILKSTMKKSKISFKS